MNTFNTSPCIDISGHINNRVAIGYSDVVWPDLDAEKQQVFYSDYPDEPSPIDVQGIHRLRHVRSSSQFQTGTVTATTVNQCATMSTWMTCATTQALRTNYSTSHAWLGGALNVPVMAWANGTTLNDGTDGRVRIAIGTLGYGLTPVGDEMTLALNDASSNVAPAVVCKSGITPYACMVFYVPRDRRGADVFVRRFNVSSNSTRYVANFESTSIRVDDASLGIIAQTGQRIAAWYSGTYFFIAVKSMSTDQNLNIFRSANGSTWSFVSGQWGTTVPGPTAVGYADWIDNVIVTTR